MSIGIDFVLRANTAGFTRGLATANNGLKDLKKTLKEGDLGGGFKRLLGAGAIIEGFRIAINNAQELRDQMESMGRAVDPAVASVARLGDSLDAAGKGLKNIATSALGFFTQAGDAIGGIINTFRFGAQAENIEKLSERTARDADKQEKRRDAALAARESRNTPEAIRRLKEQQAAVDTARSGVGLTKEAQLNNLLAQQVALREQLSALQRNPFVVANDQAKIEEKILAIKMKGKEIDEATLAANEQKRKLLEAQTDKFLPSIEELALFQGGTNVGNDAANARGRAAQQARSVFSLEMQSRAAYQKGDLSGALSLQQRADQARFGLSGQAKSDEVNKGRDLTESVNKNTEILDAIQKAIESRSIAAQ